MSITAQRTKLAREYLRVSKDKTGKAASTNEQHVENAEAAGVNGWHLGEPYLDNDRSASRYATKAREDYDRLVADLTADRFGADVLILWEGSRGSRKVLEWVLLLGLLEERHVLVHVTSHGRTYDPTNPHDRKTLLVESADSEYESGKTSMRGRRTAASHAAAGRPTGRTPFGYRREYTYDTVDGKQVRSVHQVPDEETAPLVRELFDAVKGGKSLRSIERDWRERGITNRSGGPFSAQHLRSMLLTRAYVGQRVHTPGSDSGNAAKKPQLVTQGLWEPLVDTATFNLVQRTLTDPARRTSRPGRGVHLLSMIAACDPCGSPLTVTYAKHPTGEYTCRASGHVRVSKPELDEFAEAVLLDRLARPEEYREFLAAEADDAALAKARNLVATVQGELDDLARQVGAGALSATLAASAEPAILARLATAQEQVKELETPSRLRGLIEPGPGVRGRWEAAPMSTKREVARLLLAPEMIGQLRVTRRPRDAGPTHVAVGSRVEWRVA